mmetsp:Transcript_17672/g.29686  ORF Transcript_17672/g.29686 Transcript_17672/m.29686 type:complete len:246 (-) Transcript_17672:900-1637(-)
MARADAPQGSLFSLQQGALVEIESGIEENPDERNGGDLSAVYVLPQAVTSHSAATSLRDKHRNKQQNKAEHAESDFAIWTRLQSLRDEVEDAEAEDVEIPCRNVDIQEAFKQYKKESKLEQTLRAGQSSSAEASIEKRDEPCLTSDKFNMSMTVQRQETFKNDTVVALKAIIEEQVEELVASKKKINWLLDDQETYDREIAKLEVDKEQLEQRNKSLLLMIEELKRERDDAKIAVEWRRNRLLGK